VGGALTFQDNKKLRNYSAKDGVYTELGKEILVAAQGSTRALPGSRTGFFPDSPHEGPHDEYFE
jgi:hypothetical protein